MSWIYNNEAAYRKLELLWSCLSVQPQPSQYELLPMASDLAMDPEKKIVNSNDDDDVLVQLGYTQGMTMHSVRFFY